MKNLNRLRSALTAWVGTRRRGPLHLEVEIIAVVEAAGRVANPGNLASDVVESRGYSLRDALDALDAKLGEA